MTAFQIEAVAELDSNGNTRGLGAMTALRDGGFAIVQISRTDAEVVVFGRTNDGGAQRIGGDIPLSLGSGARVLSRADGGFVVIDRVLDASEPSGNLNVLHAFDALGGSLESYSFTGSVSLIGFDTTLDPEVPELWAVRTISGVRTLVLKDPDTMIPTDPLTEVSFPPFNGFGQLFFDGGFRFEIGQTRGEIRQAEPVRPGIGPNLPTFFNPGSITDKITTGNQIVEVVAGSRPSTTGSLFDYFVSLRHFNPDGSAPVTTLDDVVGNELDGGPSTMLTEVPGIGYALLITMIDSFQVATGAEVRLFSFAGDELGRQSLDGMVGQRILNMQFKALVDPDHQAVRLLTVWTPSDLPNGSIRVLPAMGEIAVIDPEAKQFALGTDFADYLAGLDTADDLFGGMGGDVLDGFGGDDALFGGLGDNRIRGGDGNDRIDAEDGDDLLNGGRGNDRITCGDGQDSVFGGFGRDHVSASKGKDLIFGEGGADILSGGQGDDAIFGDSGNDSLQGDEGNDALGGGEGNDLVSGGEGDDLVEGDAQDDTVLGGLGSDTLVGGDGNDLLHATSADLADLETFGNLMEGGRGLDTLFGNGGNDTMDGGDGDDVIFGDGAAGPGDDSITGGDGRDDLFGGGGSDDLSGGRGADTLGGGTGADFLSGGLGRARLIGGAGVDAFVFASAEEAGLGKSRDVIRDFSIDADVIDLSGIFAATPVFIQENSFSGTQAELRYLFATGIIEGDVNGDGAADFQIELTGAPVLTGSEFVF